ncbi:MAG: SpoIIE family protein phosphatase [Bacteroidetes bacterium]|nr:SpoIIE family protein phosphatase [Bacteroidota bacterium]
MNLNKLGKILLSISGIIFLLFIITLFIYEDFFDSFPGILILIGIGTLYIFMCLSLSLIYFNSSIQKRKKVIKVISTITASIFIIGWFFKFMHWAGANVCLTLSCFSFVLSALPLIIKSRYENRSKLVTSKTLLLNFFDLFSTIFIIIGFMSKILHWPGGAYMINTGIVMLVFSFILWNIFFRKEVKLRAVVEEKLKKTLHEVEEKQKEITDSITYAKRIQEAILPSLNFINTHLPNSFIYYQPKDIVAGDFYWAEKTNNGFLIAAADCTGHGVPGALVSVVCCNALNRSVKEFKLSDPGKILDKTRELVLESFSKNGGDIKDGMDISLVSINANKISWAGANNPLWYFKNNKLEEITANKQAIGMTDNPTPFTTHVIELSEGDSLYLFTDGFADQFGGPKGKKFKYKQLEELIISNKHLSSTEQHQALESTLNKWKANLEQVDDICVIGIKIN